MGALFVCFICLLLLFFLIGEVVHRLGGKEREIIKDEIDDREVG